MNTSEVKETYECFKFNSRNKEVGEIYNNNNIIIII